MFCPDCGKEIREGAKFCPHCGHPIPEVPAFTKEPPEAPTAPASASLSAKAPTPSEPPQHQQPAPAPILGQKKKRSGALLGVLAAVVAVVLVVGIAAATFLGSPKAKVGKAALASVEAYASAGEDLGITALAERLRSHQFSQSLRLEFQDVPGNSYADLNPALLAGLKAQLQYGVNLPERELNLSSQLQYGSLDIASFRLLAQDQILSCDFPELLGDSAYGVNTTTLGADLARLFPGSVSEKISLNLFDSLEVLAKEPVLSEEALKDFLNAIEVEKLEKPDAKKDLDINGQSLTCKGYSVRIPESAAKDFLNAAEDAILATGYSDALETLGRGLDLSDDEIRDLTDSYEQELTWIINDWKEFLDEAGDLELELYLHDGYVVFAETELELYGSDLELRAALGGEDHYVDALTLELETDGHVMTITSSGDHTADSGILTDTTEAETDGTAFLTSEIQYDRKAQEDNFSWNLNVEDELDFQAEGTLFAGPEAFTLDLEDLSCTSYGETLSLELFWSTTAYEPVDTMDEAILLSDMSPDDVIALQTEIATNIQAWVLKMFQGIPALQSLFLPTF